MFTGIITDVGRIEAIEARGDLRLRIGCGYDMTALDIGASIACSGVCLTVVDKGENWFAVDVSSETQARTAPETWTEGGRLNLERALRVGDELGGHIVSGHVDGVARILDRRPEGESVRFVIEAPAALMPFIAPKGSVALDGVSLTVNEVDSDRFGVNIIPHTLSHTGFGEARPGTRMNLEIDPLARYVARLLDAGSALGARPEIAEQFSR
jgi:riboflavin synthase